MELLRLDYETAAKLACGEPVSKEKAADFSRRSRWAHDEVNSNRNTIVDLRAELARRDAEIAMLKEMLLERENDA